MPIIKDLSVSIHEGPAPLIVGFFLNGPNIGHRKRWHFEGQSSGKEDNNLIHTHTYDNPGNYDVWVDIIDENNKVVESSIKKTIHVKNKTQVIAGFTQWQGVIYEGDAVGFSISHDIPGTPKIIWSWGDGKVDSTDDRKFYPHRLNPHHSYEKNGVLEGEVTIKETSGRNGITESRKFAVMVLPDKRKEFAGFIEIISEFQRPRTIELPVNKELKFQAQVTGVDEKKYSFLWDFGDKSGGSGRMTTHTYHKSDNYSVSCTIRNKGGNIGNKIILCKTAVIT